MYMLYLRCLERIQSAKCKANNVFLPERWSSLKKE